MTPTAAPAGRPTAPAAPEWAAALQPILEILADIQSKVTAQCKAHLTTAEVAAEACRSEFTVRRWIAEGRLKAVKVEGDGPRGRWLIPRSELAKLVSQGLAASLPDRVG